MVLVSLLIGLLDVWAGELGTLGTPLPLLVAAIVASFIGARVGIARWVKLYDAEFHRGERPKQREIVAAMLFLAIEAITFGAVFMLQTPPDHPVVLVAALLTFFLTKVKPNR